MTETEKQQIISLVLQALKTNSLTIEHMVYQKKYIKKQKTKK